MLLSVSLVRGFPGGATVKNPPADAGDRRDAGSVPGLGRLTGGGNGNPLQYSCLGSPVDRGALAGSSPWGHKELDATEHTGTHSTNRRQEF